MKLKDVDELSWDAIKSPTREIQLDILFEGKDKDKGEKLYSFDEGSDDEPIEDEGDEDDDMEIDEAKTEEAKKSNLDLRMPSKKKRDKKRARDEMEPPSDDLDFGNIFNMDEDDEQSWDRHLKYVIFNI